MAGTPDHPITVTPNPNRVKVTFAGKVVADTRNALSLRKPIIRPCCISRGPMSTCRC